MRIFISKLLITTCIVFHVYLLACNQTQMSRLDRNSVNNIKAKLSPYISPKIDQFLCTYVQEVIIGLLACSIPMLFSRNSIYKVLTLVGIVLFQFFNLHHRVIVPNSFSLRHCLGVGGGIVYLMAVDQPVGKNKQTSTLDQEYDTKQIKHTKIFEDRVQTYYQSEPSATRKMRRQIIE